MAKRINNQDFVLTPAGGFNRHSVKSVTPMDSGVAVIDDSNSMIFWIEEPDKSKAKKVSKALMAAVMSGKTIDWAELGYED